jgi:hypothetical protein
VRSSPPSPPIGVAVAHIGEAHDERRFPVADEQSLVLVEGARLQALALFRLGAVAGARRLEQDVDLALQPFAGGAIELEPVELLHELLRRRQQRIDARPALAPHDGLALLQHILEKALIGDARDAAGLVGQELAILQRETVRIGGPVEQGLQMPDHQLDIGTAGRLGDRSDGQEVAGGALQPILACPVASAGGFIADWRRIGLGQRRPAAQAAAAMAGSISF